MIENEKQLRHSVQAVAKMYSLCERIAADTTGYPETRADEIESIQSMIRKIEREIAVYLAKKYEIGATEKEQAEKEQSEKAA